MYGCRSFIFWMRWQIWPTVLRKLKESATVQPPDIISVVQDKNVIIFKSFKPDTSSLCRYKEIIAESIASC